MTDDARIRAALPTIELLLERDARLILCSHLGRPKDREPETSLAPVSKRLAELIDAPVAQAADVVGDDARAKAEALEPGQVLVLENTRWEPGETENDPELARSLAELASAYVNDAFGAAHRAHASTAGVAEHLPSAAGLLLEREVTTLRGIVESPERPLVVVLGGAKVSDKVALIDRFLDAADTDPDRRRDVLQLLPRAGQADRRLAGGGGGRGARPRGPRQGGEGRERRGCCCRSTSCWPTASTRTPSAASRTAPTCPTAGWGSTSGPPDRGGLRARDRRRGHRVLERADGRVRDGAVRGGHPRGGRGGGRGAGHDGGRRRRLRRGDGGVRAGRPGHAPVHRRRRGAGAARGQAAARAWRRSTMPDRRPYIAGNWKLWGTRAQTVEYCERLLTLLPDASRRPADVGLCVPFTALDTVVAALRGLRRDRRGPEHARGEHRRLHRRGVGGDAGGAGGGRRRARPLRAARSTTTSPIARCRRRCRRRWRRA